MEEANNEEKFCKDLTEQNKIVELLDNLKKEKKDEEYLSQLQLYYPILSPDICKNYNISKAKTEKETLFCIIDDLIKKLDEKINNGKKEFNKDDISELYNFLDSILKKPAEDELKYLNIESYPSRWDTVYSKIIRIENEINDELIYYNLTNDLLQNIKNNEKPYEILSFLKEFMKLYNKLPFKNNLQNITKKFILIGLCNCEYVDKINPRNFLETFDNLLNLNNNLTIWNDYINNKIFNPNSFLEGKLHKSLLKFANSKLAKNSFKEIFGMKEIPVELEKEIFSNNIEKYICYFPYSSRSDTERTIKRFSMILINSNKNKKFLQSKMKF